MEKWLIKPWFPDFRILRSQLLAFWSLLLLINAVSFLYILLSYLLNPQHPEVVLQGYPLIFFVVIISWGTIHLTLLFLLRIVVEFLKAS